VIRVVRVTEDFWAALDLALPATGEPSWHAFAAHDIPRIMERFANGWDDLPQQIPGRDDYRIYIDAGRTVAVYAVEGQLAHDGAVELVAITIDVAWPSA
jgi:hypothetical protein